MTLLENLIVVGKGKERKMVEKAMELLRLVQLDEKKDDYVSDLSFGQQKLLSLAQVLMRDAQLILLDEPAAGLNMRETRSLGEIIRKIRDELKITILLVEHDMDLVMGISDSITVLNFGEVIADGTPLEVQKNQAVIAAYLGDDEETPGGYSAHS
jgi:branched-chain amino acid transport system ATP-binding protein